MGKKNQFLLLDRYPGGEVAFNMACAGWLAYTWRAEGKGIGVEQDLPGKYEAALLWKAQAGDEGLEIVPGDFLTLQWIAAQGSVVPRVPWWDQFGTMLSFPHTQRVPWAWIPSTIPSSAAAAAGWPSSAKRTWLQAPRQLPFLPIMVCRCCGVLHF